MSPSAVRALPMALVAPVLLAAVVGRRGPLGLGFLATTVAAPVRRVVAVGV